MKKSSERREAVIPIRFSADERKVIDRMAHELDRNRSDTVRLAVSVLVKTLQAQGVKPDEK